MQQIRKMGGVRYDVMSLRETGRRKKGVERTLEGWICSKGTACELKDLASLRSLYTGKPASMEVCRPAVLSITILHSNAANRRASRQILPKICLSISHLRLNNSSQGPKFPYLMRTLVDISM